MRDIFLCKIETKIDDIRKLSPENLIISQLISSNDYYVNLPLIVFISSCFDNLTLFGILNKVTVFIMLLTLLQCCIVIAMQIKLTVVAVVVVVVVVVGNFKIQQATVDDTPSSARRIEQVRWPIYAVRKYIFQCTNLFFSAQIYFPVHKYIHFFHKFIFQCTNIFPVHKYVFQCTNIFSSTQI